MSDLVPMVICSAFIYGIYKLFELFVRKNERLKLVEKLGESITPDMLKGELNLPASSTSHTFRALKIGSLLVGMGLGLLLAYLICYNTVPGYMAEGRNWAAREAAGMIYVACVLTMGGLGLLAAFIIELKLTRKDK